MIPDHYTLSFHIKFTVLCVNTALYVNIGFKANIISETDKVDVSQVKSDDIMTVYTLYAHITIVNSHHFVWTEGD